jgi:alpha-N-arabinofuranosidase
VAVVNPTDSAQQLNLTVKGVELAGKGRLWRMAPSSIDATIVVGQKPGVEVEEHALDSMPDTATIAPISVNIFEFALK